MVESFGPAAQAARAAANAQGLERVGARGGDAAESVAQRVAPGESSAAVVVTPPRRGVSPAARDGVARLGAPVLIYVSCDPDTLARDLDHLGRLGYAAN